MTSKLFMIAGEASGDYLGAELIKTLDKQTQVTGIGGEKMQSAGMHTWMNSKDLAIVGLVEIIKRLPFILRLLRRIKHYLKHHKPDAVILIDYPGLNLRVAKIAHQLGIPVYFYVSPQIWAWRSSRIHHIKKYVDHMAVLFAFEADIYTKHQVPVSIVGHPLLNDVPQDLDKQQCRIDLGLDSTKPIIALIPGSRRQEIQSLMPCLCDSIQSIRQQLPEAQFILPQAHTIDDHLLEPWLNHPITVIKSNTHKAIKAADAAICCSGTVTLELALLQTPMVILYKMHPLSFWLGKKLVKTPYVGLSNIIANQKVSQELLQEEANADNISTEIVKLIRNQQYRQQVLKQLSKTREHLGFQHNPNWFTNLSQNGSQSNQAK